MKFACASIVLALASTGVGAFLAPGGQTSAAAAKATCRNMNQSKQEPWIPPPKDISYGEESRKYRRTVYSHDDWEKHRAPDRFIRNIYSILTSGVYKNIGNEVLAVTTIAAFVVLWNALVGGYQDFSGVQHDAILSSDFLPILRLPLAPFTLSSPSLGLLLVFRTNTSYQRWDEARKNWGMNINHTRNLVRLGTAYYDRRGVPEAQIDKDLNRLALATWSFVRSMKRHLSPEKEDEQDYINEMYAKLPPEQARRVIAAAHRPNRALQDLSFAIESLPMHFIRKNEVHRAATIFEDNLGSSERLLTSPVPLFYSRHSARFVSLWLLLLPFALYGQFGDTWNHVGMIPSAAAISVALFGIEELATQLEEPFTILPMQAFCDKIYNWLTEIITFKPNDNGMFDDDAAYYEERAAPQAPSYSSQPPAGGQPPQEDYLVDEPVTGTSRRGVRLLFK